jgi:hypothetical protein
VRKLLLMFAALLPAVLAGCVDRLPEQDLRILSASAVAKLPVEALVADYRADADAAGRQYWGKPIEVSGEVTETRQTPAGPLLVFADKAGAAIVEASLLEEQAAAIVEAVGKSRRVRLKCYCEGLSGTAVRLKSCVGAGVL